MKWRSRTVVGAQRQNIRPTRLSELVWLALVVVSSCLVVYGACQDTKVSNTDEGCADQGCGPFGIGTCSYNTSDQNSLCDCPGSACSGNGNFLWVTITPFSGFCIDGSCDAAPGTSYGSMGQVQSASCP